MDDFIVDEEDDEETSYNEDVRVRKKKKSHHKNYADNAERRSGDWLTSMTEHCAKLQEEFKGAINVHFPTSNPGDWSLFETYQLPMALESYEKPPKPLLKTVVS
jgi:hypothetical protein